MSALDALMMKALTSQRRQASITCSGADSIAAEPDSPTASNDVERTVISFTASSLLTVAMALPPDWTLECLSINHFDNIRDLRYIF